MAFDRAGGAARHPDQVAPPPVPRPRAAPTEQVSLPKYVHPANRKEGQA
jgi:hypothetical protein